MIKKTQLVILLSGVIVCFPPAVLAETIRLKSGETIEGEIVEKTDQSIIIEWNGIKVPYSRDEIESNGDGAQPPSPPINTSPPPENTTAQEPNPAQSSSGDEYYHNKEYRVKLWHPKDWEVFDSDTHTEAFAKIAASLPLGNDLHLICALSCGKDWDALNPLIMLLVERRSDALKDLSAEELTARTIRDPAQVSSHFNILGYTLEGHPEAIESGEKKVMTYAGTKMVRGKEWVSRTNAFVKGASLYMIVGAADAETADSVSDVFDEMAASYETE